MVSICWRRQNSRVVFGKELQGLRGAQLFELRKGKHFAAAIVLASVVVRLAIANGCGRKAITRINMRQHISKLGAAVLQILQERVGVLVRQLLYL